MERDSFVFYRSFYEAFCDLDDENALACFHAIAKYALDGEEPEGKNIVTAIFKTIKPIIDKNNKRYENGKKGGRPKNEAPESPEIPEEPQAAGGDDPGQTEDDIPEPEPKPNKNQIKTELKPKDNQTKTKLKPNENQTETKPEPNVHVDDNVNYLKEKHTKEKSGDFSRVCVETINYLNLKCGTKYEPEDKKLYSQIRGRIKDGHTLEEFKLVIDKKARDWLGSAMSRHLNPFTLFKSPKFEVYLGEAEPKQNLITNFPTQFHVGMKSEADYSELEQKLLEN
jgi:uncharacterized phage protein (TIGR02220 family)